MKALPLLVLVSAVAACSAPRVARRFPLDGGARVVVCTTAARAELRQIADATEVRISGRPTGDQRGYHTSDPAWRPLRARDVLDFTAARADDVLVVEPSGEILDMHTHFQLEDVIVEVPANVPVELRSRTLERGSHVKSCAPWTRGRLALDLDDQTGRLDFPVAVHHAGGSTVLERPGSHTLELPVTEGRLTRITIEDLPPIWVEVPPGGMARLHSHPCCEVGFEGAYLPDVPIVEPKVRFVRAPDAPADAVVTETLNEVTYTPAATAEAASYVEPGIPVGHLLDFQVTSAAHAAPVERIALDTGAGYTVWIGERGITGVTRDW